ncbi:alpha-L-fucosidase [Aureibaculum sp. A20]|uniref:alpha-L-fucosidase n=1 Tax=Aureibaculum flavum TaxID=2795986 RepID=A0ABS0WU64_9FLAO|nr:alpha-L-fucosidase [Aureibaculum flavum]MBJ2175507.1 alpha-L-fucosidase [Aureibaculum flavum]
MRTLKLMKSTNKIIKQKITVLIIISLCCTYIYAQVPTEDPPHGELHPMLAEVIEAGPYVPQWKSLVEHPMPDWFLDRKVGLSAHWGPYAVPGWTPKKDTPYGVAYSEWYWEWLKQNEAVKKHHKKIYGDASYDDFIDGTKNLITGEIEGFDAKNFDADEWMKIMKKAGVKYFFITSKHHDGFCIFDSKYTDRNSKKMGPKRDLYGEMVEAARKNDIKIGFYYSFYEWNNPIYKENNDLNNYKGLKVLKDEDKDGILNEYVDDFMIPQIKELIDKYHPDYICFDGEWDYPYPHWRSRQILAYYYNQAVARGQEVVINDRFGQKKEGFSDTRGVYGDFSHVEYYANIDSTKTWAMWRGFGNSYGYNKNEHPDNILSPKKVINTIIDCVSHNGNIEFNVGPKSDGTFSEIDLERLYAMGKWLKINGEAIYNTRVMKPYQEKQVYFTQKKDAIYVIYSTDDEETTPPSEIYISSFQPNDGVKITLLGVNKKLKWEKRDKGFIVKIPKSIQENPPSEHAWAIKVSKNTP